MIIILFITIIIYIILIINSIIMIVNEVIIIIVAISITPLRFILILWYLFQLKVNIMVAQLMIEFL